MNFKLKAIAKSPWLFHLATGTCNNCDIELLDCLTPRYDVERLGIQLVGSIRHADVIFITGAMNRKCAARLKTLYEQAPKPCVVISCGTCAITEHMFRESYNTTTPVDSTVPVDVYIPGCPPKPEAIISGIIKGLEKLISK